jgi:2-polyprenyl-3-methyl-5-hydroxy-6-metoxy-1,4-benzoquinol methylase
MSRTDSIQQLNLDFYETIAQDFDSTRNHAWPGFAKTLQWIDTQSSVLDIGCGNARFLNFLLEHEFVGKYTGVDSNTQLIAHAPHFQAASYHNSSWQDWISQDTNTDTTITCFGLLHHISSAQEVLQLLDYCYHHSSTLILSRWNCIMNDTLMQRRLDIESQEGQKFLQHYSLQLEEWEPMEFFLDWNKGNHAYRYVRYWTDQELQELLAKRGLTIVTTWINDGKSGAENTYFVIKKIDASARTIITN